MVKNPEKTAGNHGPCFKCGTQMFCNEVEYNNNKKLQWQEQDGKAHYSFDVATQKTTCRQPNPEQSSTSQVDLTNFKAELVDKVEEKIWMDVVNKCAEYSILAQRHLGEYPEITNPALKGMITKVAFEVLNQINERKIKK